MRLIWVLLVCSFWCEAQIPTSGLVLEYGFEGYFGDVHGMIGAPVDSSGTQLATDRFGTPNACAAFDGNDYLEFSPASLFDFNNTEAFSLAFWFYDENPTPANTHVLMGYDGTCSDFSYSIQIKPDSLLSVGVHASANTGNEGCWNSGIAQITRFTWHHCAVVITSTTRYIYLNGELVSSTILNTSNWGYFTDAKWVLGAWQSRHNSYKEYHFTGKLDDLLVYDRGLSETEVSQIYNNGLTTTENLSLAKDYLWNGNQISSLNGLPLQIELFDMNGNLIQTENNSIFDLSFLPSGVYVARLNQGVKQSVLKLVK